MLKGGSFGVLEQCLHNLPGRRLRLGTFRPLRRECAPIVWFLVRDVECDSAVQELASLQVIRADGARDWCLRVALGNTLKTVHHSFHPQKGKTLHGNVHINNTRK